VSATLPHISSFQYLDPSPERGLVAIVVVHYGFIDQTRQCIQSLLEQDYAPFFIVLVDNNSPDGSGPLLRRLWDDDRVVVVLNPENRGFAAGANIGIKYGLEHGAEFIWLVNPDAQVRGNALLPLVETLNNDSRVAAAGSKILSAQGAIWGAGAFIDEQKQSLVMRGTGENDDGQYEESFECDYLPGCSLLLRSQSVYDVGYLPEEYFLYFEETEWCSRLKNRGQRLLYVPESVVEHDSEAAKMQAPLRVYYYNRNTHLFWFRRSGVLKKVRQVLRVALFDLPRAYRALRAAPDDQHRLVFTAHVAAHRDFLLGRFGRSRQFS